MIAVNRDIMIRTAALIVAFTFFTAQGARSGDTVLAANAVLYNLLLVGAFFLDGFATAAEQLCGRAIGRARLRRVRGAPSGWRSRWGFGFAVAVGATFLAGGPQLIALMTASADVRATDRALPDLRRHRAGGRRPRLPFDGIYVGATWARDMRNLMLISLALYFAAWWMLQPLRQCRPVDGAILLFLVGRGILQALRYPALLRATFGPGESVTGAVLPAGGRDEHRRRLGRRRCRRHIPRVRATKATHPLDLLLAGLETRKAAVSVGDPEPAAHRAVGRLGARGAFGAARTETCRQRPRLRRRVLRERNAPR